MDFLNTPRSLPRLSDWSPPPLPDLPTPSLTSAALARAGASVTAAITGHNDALHGHDADVHAFIAAAARIDDHLADRLDRPCW